MTLIIYIVETGSILLPLTLPRGELARRGRYGTAVLGATGHVPATLAPAGAEAPFPDVPYLCRDLARNVPRPCHHSPWRSGGAALWGYQRTVRKMMVGWLAKPSFPHWTVTAA